MKTPTNSHPAWWPSAAQKALADEACAATLAARKLQLGDRVTMSERPGVLGTVKRANDVGDAYVEWHAYGHLALGWIRADKLTVWRQA